MTAPEEKTVREFRHMLLWPLQLRRLTRASPYAHHWEALRANPHVPAFLLKHFRAIWADQPA